ncbi:MAG: ankyrin repeat domain-containing protein [Candidatus Dependentiae bacterium]
MMKKIVFIFLSVPIFHITGMEQNQPTYPLNELPADMQQVILLNMSAAAASQAENVIAAVQAFKKLGNVSKFFMSKASVFNFLNAAKEKFLGQEGRIARLLNNEYAKEWLKNIKPELKRYKMRYPNQKELFAATNFIKKNQLDLLKQWLDQGFDPNAIGTEGPLIFIAIRHHHLEAVKLLVSYGLDINLGYREFFTDPQPQTPLQFAQQQINQNVNNPAVVQVFEEIDAYLRANGAF